MRTTLTLDDDVAREVRERMRERDAGFKETVNDLLRRGLAAAQQGPTRYDMPVFSATIRPGIDLDKAVALAAALEDDELLRKLELGK